MSATQKGRSYRSAARRSPQLAKALKRLGKQIQMLRHQAEMTQEELASNAGLDPKHLQEIEAGRINTTVATLIAIAKAVGACPSDLLKGV